MDISSEKPIKKEETEEKTQIEKETDRWMSILLEENSEEMDVIIEIPRNSRIKYEYDKVSQRMVCDRVLTTPFSYFFNYGFLPNTLSEDGDPIDAVVLMEDAIFPGCSIRCRILGVLETEDEKGQDPKLILCPVSKVDPGYDHWKDILDVSIAILNKIKHFFTHYKDLEEGKYVKVGHFMSKEDARQIIIDSRIRYFSGLMDEGKLILQSSEKST
jgi:inorganic pyrophosphatase